MRVGSGTRKGFIFFRDGEVVHAEMSHMKGEEAFYDIMAWDLGRFECDEIACKAETIHESWDFLLMESMRRIDSPELE
jgi:hypothetical protein